MWTPDDCGYTPFDYDVEKAHEDIVRTHDIYGIDERILEELENGPEIKAITEEIFV